MKFSATLESNGCSVRTRLCGLTRSMPASRGVSPNAIVKHPRLFLGSLTWLAIYAERIIVLRK